MREARKFIDSIQIVGIIISVSFSIFLIFSANQDALDSIIISIGIAILFQLIDMQVRALNTSERVLEVNSLTQDLYKDPFLLKKIKQIVNDYEDIKNGWYDVFKDRADYALNDFHHTIHALSEGYMTFNRGSIYSFGTVGIMNAEKNLRSTTTTEGPFREFWTSIHGEKYLHGNAEAIARGVEFTRVFINSRESIVNDYKILKNHQSIGIDIYIVFYEDIKKELNESFIIMDDKLVTRTELAHNGRVREWRTSINPSEVNFMIHRFEVIMRSARTLDEALIELGITATPQLEDVSNGEPAKLYTSNGSTY